MPSQDMNMATTEKQGLQGIHARKGGAQELNQVFRGSISPQSQGPALPVGVMLGAVCVPSRGTAV